MSSILANEYRNSTIMKVFYEKNFINLEPEYQRLGNIWSVSKKQLLIDSIINEYDIPKIYFHELYPTINDKKFAVIDGRQRLEAIFDFIEGKYSLSNEIRYNNDTNINLKGLSYKDLGEKYPHIKINFDSFVLPIIIIQTEDIELIEDMFSRLNDGVLLNAAEKRNAFGGEAINKIRQIIENDFFQSKIKITNHRFQHYEIATRFLMIEDKLLKKLPIDTSKSILDKFVSDNKKSILDTIYYNVLNVLKEMNEIFENQDQLLKRQGDMVVYYLLFKIAIDNNIVGKINKSQLLNFQQQVSILSGQDEDEKNQDFITYYYYSQQGTNGFSNIKTRLRIIMSYLEIENRCNSFDYLFQV